VRDDAAGRRRAVGLLRAGGLVALPTDTVYGIAVDLATPGGVERLVAAKNRPPDKGVMLLLAEPGQAAEVGIWGEAAQALANAFWPGGLTLVLPQIPGLTLPAALTGGTPTVGVRLPDHPAPRALAAALGPLPTTSANVSGRAEARDAGEIVEQLGDAVDLVLDGGPAHGGPPSTVVDLSHDRPTILRAGAVPIDRIEAVLTAAGARLAPTDVGR
jgi:L-threonylcarbamoyladenylate synthase